MVHSWIYTPSSPSLMSRIPPLGTTAPGAAGVVPPLQYNGACLCRGIRYTLTRRPRRVVECHCAHCQADGGSECQIMAEYRISEVVVEDPWSYWKIYTIIDGTQSGQAKEKHFCGNCGCTLWTVAMKDRGELRMVRTSLIENGLALFPPTEVWFKNSRKEQHKTDPSRLRTRVMEVDE